MEIVYYCPECGSENIETVCYKKPKPLRVPINDISKIGELQIEHLPKYKGEYVIKCNDCRYSVEFSM